MGREDVHKERDRRKGREERGEGKEVRGATPKSNLC